jgi:putative Holliday junction resolvase
MSRILAIDYGGKRTGLAMTDPLRIIASPLETIPTSNIIPYLKNLFAAESFSEVIIGMPLNWDESDTHATPLVKNFIQKFKKEFPNMPISEVDERFTSKMAKDTIMQMGLKKKDRQQKERVDRIAATIMLQEYMQSKGL